MYIWCVWIIYLSVVPCCLADDDCATAVAIESSATQDAQPERPQEHACSPFLMCGSCTGFTFSTHTLLLQEIPVLQVPPPKTVYQPQLSPSGWFSSIWQPPQYRV